MAYNSYGTSSAQLGAHELHADGQPGQGGYGAPPGYGGYPGQPGPAPGMGFAPGMAPPPRMGAPGMSPPPGASQAQQNNANGFNRNFQPPPEMSNFNFAAPVIRMGTSGPPKPDTPTSSHVQERRGPSHEQYGNRIETCLDALRVMQTLLEDG